MRIKENVQYDCESYTSTIQEQVVEVFRYASKIIKMKRILDEIKRESLNLQSLLWTEEELKKKNEALSFFDARMQATVYYTLKNMERYQQYGWKELVRKGENEDD